MAGHVLTVEDGRKGGKKSKRGPSIKKRWEKLLESPLPSVIKKALKEKRIVLPSGETVALAKAAMASNVGDALALAVLTEALAMEPWAVKMVVEQVDGKPKEAVEISGNLDETSLIFKAKPKPEANE